MGAAAAIAAAFNTPLAAVLFSLEEIVGDLHAPVLGSVVLASATRGWCFACCSATIRSSKFRNINWSIRWNLRSTRCWAWLGAGFGGLHETACWAFGSASCAFPQNTVWFQPVAGGLLVGLMGWFVPQVLGVGYGYVGDVLNGNMAFNLMVLLLVLKLLAVTTSYSSGNAGGIFGPSLFIGAMLGGTVGTVAHRLLPGYTASAGAYALVGMGAVFAGVVRAPMTSVLMIFEMTQDYAVIVPLMIANLVSLFISSRLQRQPIYEALAVQDGIHLPQTHGRQRDRRIVRLMRTAPELFSGELTVGEALEKLHGSESRTCLVTDGRGLTGVVSVAMLAQSSGQQKLSEVVDALVFPHIHSDQGLEVALERMGANQLEILPVVSRADVHKLEGIVTLRDVLDAYGVSLP